MARERKIAKIDIIRAGSHMYHLYSRNVHGNDGRAIVLQYDPSQSLQDHLAVVCTYMAHDQLLDVDLPWYEVRDGKIIPKGKAFRDEEL